MLFIHNIRINLLKIILCSLFLSWCSVYSQDKESEKEKKVLIIPGDMQQQTYEIINSVSYVEPVEIIC
jgi:hypothetical protein